MTSANHNHVSNPADHRVRALAYADAVVATCQSLDEAHSDRAAHNAGQIARLNRDLGASLKLAEVHAVLAVADELKRLRTGRDARPDFTVCNNGKCVLEHRHGGPCLTESEPAAGEFL